jgi:hypothetical protein
VVDSARYLYPAAWIEMAGLLTMSAFIHLAASWVPLWSQGPLWNRELRGHAVRMQGVRSVSCFCWNPPPPHAGIFGQALRHRHRWNVQPRDAS